MKHFLLLVQEMEVGTPAPACEEVAALTAAAAPARAPPVVLPWKSDSESRFIVSPFLLCMSCI